MKKDAVNMVFFGEALLADIKFWSRELNIFRTTSLVFDTGAVTTTISVDVLKSLGYDTETGRQVRIITASGFEFVREVSIDKLRIGRFELENIKVYAHTFPLDSYSSGVIGLNVLSLFDINLLFSKRLIELTKIDV